jgi:hypothetical protein
MINYWIFPLVVILRMDSFNLEKVKTSIDYPLLTACGSLFAKITIVIAYCDEAAKII